MSRPRMRVYAAGRNEFGQLSFGPDEHGGPKDFPQDIHSFTPILQGDTIDQVVASSSYTIARIDGALVSAGSALQLRRYPDPRREQDDSVIWAEDGTGQVLAAKTSSRDSHSTPCHELVQYLSVEAWAAREPSRSWPCENPVKQIASYETGWIILHKDGTVKTLGDRRYHDCLGRPAAPQSSPAEDPCELPDLVDLDEPFKYVAAGGYTVAAVTQSGALYIWGMKSPSPLPNTSFQPTLECIPNYVEVDGGKDVDQVAIGHEHTTVITTDGSIYARGCNTSGQLGLGKGSPRCTDDWTRVDIDHGCEYEPYSIIAGPRASLVVVKRRGS